MLVDGMHENQITSANELCDGYGVGVVERLNDDGSCAIHEPPTFIQIARESNNKTHDGKNVKQRLRGRIARIPLLQIVKSNTLMLQCGLRHLR